MEDTVDFCHGQIIARLADDERVSSELVNLINTNVAPLEPVEEQDVYIRAMLIVSDQVNSFGGRFPVEEHARLAQLLVDSPVLIGHRKDRLPIGRTFHAVTVSRETQQWVKSYFYWLRSSENAQDLKDNIDAGIYKECSIGFTFRLPQCSICGRDIRSCEHEPLAEYAIGGVMQVCHFDYREIEKVLETSLVYRGATPDTSISKELHVAMISHEKPGDDSLRQGKSNLEELETGARYLVTPSYEGVDVTVCCTSGALMLKRLDGSTIVSDVLCDPTHSNVADFPETKGRLVGYRGKERCSETELEKFLSERPGPVSRAVLYLLPSPQFHEFKIDNDRSRVRIRVIRHQVMDASGVAGAARALMTKDGVDIWRLNQSGECTDPLRVSREQIEQALTNTYRLITMHTTGHAIFHVAAESIRRSFMIRQFDRTALMRGSRFVADTTGEEPSNAREIASALSGRVARVEQKLEGMRLTLAGDLEGTFVLQPIILDRRRGFLFYRPTTQ
jgi:hypothetical protein